MKKKKYLLAGCLLALLNACGGHRQQPAKEAEWKETAAGVWTASVGTPEKVNLTSELHIQPKLEAISQMGNASLPFQPADITMQVTDGICPADGPAACQDQPVAQPLRVTRRRAI